MPPYRFDLATPADDADLRRVLAGTPMPGWVSVAFRREPSYFAAAVVDGPFRQVGVVRDGEAGQVVGFGSRSVAARWINGRAEPVGYLSNLRLLPPHRNRGLLARAYAFLRKLHGDGRARLYLTTIAEDNVAARELLTSGRAGLPPYHPTGRFHTAAIPLARRPRPHRPDGVEVRPASPGDLPELLAFLRAEGPARQFFPVYGEGDFFRIDGRFLGLAAGDLLLARRGGRLVGMLGAWDQRPFRQTVVAGYAGPLGVLRPLYNGWAALRGRPRLPKAGEELRCLTAALPVVEGADLEVFAALLGELLDRHVGAADYLLLGLHEADPLLGVVRRHPAAWYTAVLYLVCWPDGEGLRQALDGRPPYLELGSS